jgi:hypothetical protein
MATAARGTGVAGAIATALDSRALAPHEGAEEEMAVWAAGCGNGGGAEESPGDVVQRIAAQ